MDSLAATSNIDELKQKFIYIEPTGEHKYTLIFLHGLGDSAKGLQKYFGIKGSPLKISNMRIVLPTAPRRDMTLNKMRMNSWYDIYKSWKGNSSTGDSNSNISTQSLYLAEGKQDEVQQEIWARFNQQHIVESSELLIKLIEEERQLF